MFNMMSSPMDLGVSYVRVCRFDEGSAAEFHAHITRISESDPTYPIRIYIDSYGGNVDALASMIETMESIPNKIITICTGKAMSCGAILLAAGDYRFCGKNSRILIHEIQSGAVGDPYDLKNSSEEIMRLNKHWLDFFAKKCGLKDYTEFRGIIHQNEGKDMYFTPEQAKEFGIIDDVGFPVIKPLIMYHIDIAGAGTPEGDFLNEGNVDDILGAKVIEEPKKKKKKKVSKKKASKKVSKKTTKNAKKK